MHIGHLIEQIKNRKNERYLNLYSDFIAAEVICGHYNKSLQPLPQCTRMPVGVLVSPVTEYKFIFLYIAILNVERSNVIGCNGIRACELYINTAGLMTRL